MTSKGYNTLKAIVQSSGTSFVDLVVSARDKNLDDDCYELIKNYCEEQGISFADRSQSPSVKTPYAFAIAWRWLIDLGTESKLIVFHDSLLPKYRGFAPLVNSLINNEKTIGVTALFADKEYDCGNIICQSASTINYPTTINQAIELVNRNYEEVCLKVAKWIKEGKGLPSLPQNEKEATYSLWRDEEDYRINWHLDAAFIARFVDATGFPYKGASTLLEDKLIRVRRAVAVPDVTIENRDAGKVIFVENGLPVVVCGSGLLKLTEACYEDGTTCLPLKKFRIRFK